MDTNGIMGAKFPQERGPRGDYPLYYFSNPLSKIILCINLLIFLRVSKPQSLNTCKRVGVKNYIP
jgi:hypothetical protein